MVVHVERNDEALSMLSRVVLITHLLETTSHAERGLASLIGAVLGSNVRVNLEGIVARVSIRLSEIKTAIEREKSSRRFKYLPSDVGSF